MNIQRVRYKDIEQIPKIDINKKFKQDFQGSSPAPFIGKYGYPNINVGFLSPQFSGDTSHYDSPNLWSKGKFPINSIASLRYGLVNSRTEGNILSARKPNRFLEIIQEVGMAKKAVELEVNLNNIPQLQLRSHKEIIPFGPTSKLQKARITANTKVDSRVERVVSDIDLKSAQGIISLYKKGFEENFLTKLMSVGNTGLKKNRILVPTRFSITAIDNIIGDHLVKEVKQHNVGDFAFYFGGEWGNYYLLLFFPEIWTYELFEMYLGHKVNKWSREGNFYSTDYEPYEGRKSYAEECAGGFYSVRQVILEKMNKLKRQHSCLALRFITSEYNIPLGVWITREASRKALENKPIYFSSKELMFRYASEFIKKKFNFNINLLLDQSIILKNLKQQTKLKQFL